MFNLYTAKVYDKQFDPVNYLSHYPFAVINSEFALIGLHHSFNHYAPRTYTFLSDI